MQPYLCFFWINVSEKHFTLDKNDGGVYHFPMDPTDLTTVSKELKNSWKSIGRVNYTRSEKKSITSSFNLFS